MPSRVPLSIGTMCFGPNERITDLNDVQKCLDVFKSFGQNQLDTARMYGTGHTEEYLGQLDLSGLIIDTKVYPASPGDHAPEKLRQTFKTSLEKLKVKKVRILYLHAPDRATPFEDTIREMDALHKEGLFEEFGLSNYASWVGKEVALVWSIADKNGWIKPTAYQGMYNAITREAESELIPCLRKLNMRFLVYNPLAGGLLARKPDVAQNAEQGGRFDESGRYGKMYRPRYFKSSFFSALEHLNKELGDIRPAEAALRWMQHHSQLNENDAVIIGGSSLAQFEGNCRDSEGGPLPENVLKAIDEAQKIFKPDAPQYWR